MSRKKKEITINVDLKCPDGLYESAGFNLPQDLDSFINYVNAFHNQEGYSIKLEKFDLIKTIAELRS